MIRLIIDLFEDDYIKLIDKSNIPTSANGNVVLAIRNGQIVGAKKELEPMSDTVCRCLNRRQNATWEYGYTYTDGNYVRCSYCREIIKQIYPMHFCPSCGSDMRGGAE